MEFATGPVVGRRLANDLGLDTGITGFMFLCTALVQFMTPGLGFFYAGMLPEKSVIQLCLQSFISLGVIFCLWCLVGFSLTFGEAMVTIGGWHLLGKPGTYFALQGVDIYEPLQRAGAVVAAGFPGMLFMAYQAMFAVITPALISGGFVDRFRFGPYIIFISVWLIVVYAPLGFWNWGGGWMFQIGAWDFAGGMVVHESAGFSSLGCLLALGPRKRYPVPRTVSPHSVPLCVMGTMLLWFGWFGFNGGSALTIGGLATIAFVNTQIAPACAMLTWMLLDWTVKLKNTGQKPTLIGACAGAVCGLVVITPLAGFAQPTMAMLAGSLGALICWSMTYYNIYNTNLDDACDTVSIHGLGGFLGTIFVGCMSDPPECAGKEPPEWCANPNTCVRSYDQLRIQTICAFVSATYAAVATYFLVKLFHCFGMRHLTRQDEQAETYDFNEFGEVAYRRSWPEGPYSLVPEPPPDTESESEEVAENGKIATISKSTSLIEKPKRFTQNAL